MTDRDPIDRTDQNSPASTEDACRTGGGRCGPCGMMRLVLAIALLVACVSLLVDQAPNAFGPGERQSGSVAAQAEPPGGGRGASGLAAFDTTNLTLDPDLIRSGGPGKDGIPSLTIEQGADSPRLAAAERADYLHADSRVVAVTVNNQTRGYPLAVLNWHECVNDTLGGTPIAVVYCPLCDSVSVVDRRIDGKTLEFGISGLLANSNVLLYDRTDQALWSQVKMQAVSGPHAGQSLHHLDSWSIMTFSGFRSDHPNALVLSADTGHARNYERNPYARYFQSDRLMFPAPKADTRLSAKRRVVGVRHGDAARAYPLDRIAAEGTLTDQLAGGTVKLRADRDGNVTVVKVPEAADLVHTFYFAWSAFHPDTSIYSR